MMSRKGLRPLTTRQEIGIDCVLSYVHKGVGQIIMCAREKETPFCKKNLNFNFQFQIDLLKEFLIKNCKKNLNFNFQF